MVVNRNVEGVPLTLDQLVREHVEGVLAECGGNQRKAARALGISRWSLARRLEKFNININGNKKEKEEAVA